MATGEWGTISFELPDFLEDARDAINDFAELLIVFLEIANLVLDFVKAFIKAFLDPLVALIEAILAEILAVLRDLRQIGIYITGDWGLLGWPPEDLRGGYSAYERRMVARLTDRTDPTRPDVSSRTEVIGFFAYLSVDPTEIEQLVRFIINIIRLFGLSFFPDTSRLPVPVIRNVNYGVNALGVGTDFNFSPLGDALRTAGGTPPNKARVTWTTKHPSQRHPFNPFPQIGPSGYLVTVSTLEQGIQLRYARVRSNTDTKDAQGVPNKKVQPREYGAVLGKDLAPVVLHGGAEMLAFKGSRYEYKRNMNGDIPKDGVAQVFGVLDPASNVVIPLEDLADEVPTELGTPGDGRGEKFVLQRTFLLESGRAMAQWFAGEYNVVLDLADMPQRAVWEDNNGTLEIVKQGPAASYYVRVWSVGKAVAERSTVPQWDFTSPSAIPLGDMANAPFIIDMKSGVEAVGNPSEARQITFVNANTAEYLAALQTALLVLYLSRSDLPLLADIEAAKGLETINAYLAGDALANGVARTETGLEVAQGMIGRLTPNRHDIGKPGQTPLEWRATLYKRIKQLAYDIYEATGPMPNLEATVVDGTEELRAAKWSDVLEAMAVEGLAGWQALAGADEPTLFDALSPDTSVGRSMTYGPAPNIYSMGLDSDDVDGLFYNADSMFVGRDSEFLTWDPDSLLVVYETSADQLTELLVDAPAHLRIFYEQFVQEDGSLLVPEDYRSMLDTMIQYQRSSSSGDFTPVFAVDTQALLASTEPGEVDYGGAVVFLRGGLRSVPELYPQALLALNAATAAFGRAPDDGEWIALRLFDAFPALEEFLQLIEDWVRGIAEALKSIADAIVRYIEFIQAQILELQQLIRRINAFLQSLLGFAFALPRFSGLVLLSNGTDGLMSDLVTAQSKPFDSSRAYGGGVGVVIPFGPSFILDLIAVGGDGGGSAQFDPSTSTVVSLPPSALGVEDVQPSSDSPDDADVL